MLSELFPSSDIPFSFMVPTLLLRSIAFIQAPQLKRDGPNCCILCYIKFVSLGILILPPETGFLQDNPTSRLMSELTKGKGLMESAW